MDVGDRVEVRATFKKVLFVPFITFIHFIIILSSNTHTKSPHKLSFYLLLWLAVKSYINNLALEEGPQPISPYQQLSSSIQFIHDCQNA